MDELFTVEIHHQGHFVENPVRYVEGFVNHVDDCDPEKWSKLEVEDIVERLGYPKHKLLWYRIPGLGLEEGLRVIGTNKDAMNMTTVVKGHEQIEVYVEHIVDEVDEHVIGLQALLAPEIAEGVEMHDILIQDDKVYFNSDSDDSVLDIDYPLSDDSDYDDLFDKRTEKKDQTKIDELFGSDIEMEYGANKDDQSKNDNDEAMKSDYESEELISGKDSSETENEDEEMNETTRLSKFEIFKSPERAEHLRFVMGMLFSSLQQFKTAITEYAVRGGYGIKFKKNDRSRVRAVCEFKCPWKALCSKVPRQETYQIKTYEPKHRWNRNYKNVRLNSKFLAGKLVKKISRSKAYRAKRRALELVEGSHKEQYAKLWDYCNELKRSNPGSNIKMQVVGFEVGDAQVERAGAQKNPTFKRLYVCFDACKRGFAACRLVIGIDGCHLKGPYGGILLSAVGRDPNEEYFPLAFAVVEAENKDSWTWFLTLLFEDVGNDRTYTFTSDQQKGLDLTLKDLQPSGEHRFCCRHLYNNLRKKHPGLLIKEFFWKGAYSGYEEQFKRAMTELMKVDGAAHKWVQGVPVQVWSRHAFSGNSKTDTLLNNLCEGFNSTILEAREKPIISMVEDIRIYLMLRFHKNRTLIETVEGVLCPVIQKRLNKEITYSGKWTPLWSGDLKFEVKGFFDTFTIDLEECSYRKWLLTESVCPIDWSNKWAKPLGSNWAPSNLATTSKKTNWQAKETEEERELDEAKKGAKLRRSGITVVCKRCGRTGDNRRTCKGLVGGNKDLPGESSSQATQTQGLRVDKTIVPMGGQKQARKGGPKGAPKAGPRGGPQQTPKAGPKKAPNSCSYGPPQNSIPANLTQPPATNVTSSVAQPPTSIPSSNSAPPGDTKTRKTTTQAPYKGLKRTRISNVRLLDLHDW
ncbi:hypothetical protein Vadar_024820 [Vaccinium darrowii]|uniref:Uncharacterized protein n=1 Tax=Vaccinium darrowii TaxID=229202 RepID=A0ACB7YA51_9ERIC|nr:hypothetical protein Vadar_024820 [Vaccinium darrowii]